MIVANKVFIRFFRRARDYISMCFWDASSSGKFMKYSRGRKYCDVFAAACKSYTHCHSAQAAQPGIRAICFKALPGGGRKRIQWPYFLQRDLHDALHHLRITALTCRLSSLLTFVKHLLVVSEHRLYTHYLVYLRVRMGLYVNLIHSWVQHFPCLISPSYTGDKLARSSSSCRRSSSSKPR